MSDVQRFRGEVEICFGIVLLHRKAHIIVPKSQVEGELFRHFEIILDVIKLAGLLKGVVDEGRQDRSIQGPQQEVGGAQAGVALGVRVFLEGSGEVELTAGIRRLKNGEVHARLDFRADLYSVPSANE